MFAEFTIIGRIGKITTLDRVTKLTLATPYWNHSKRQEETRWNTVTLLNERHRNYAERFQKGETVMVRGILEDDSYEMNGETVYVTNKVVTDMNRYTVKAEQSEEQEQAA